MLMTTTLEKIANPQGKGIAAVVNDLHAYTPLGVRDKSIAQWLADYFSSSLVLCAEYKFKPVVDNRYYLYLKDKQWKLSLIEPQAWLSHDPGIYFASCKLHADMSWSVDPRNDWQHHPSLFDTVKKLQQEFVHSINGAQSITEHLPFYLAQLPYFQRLGANALARSLKLSLELKLGHDAITQLSGLQLLAELNEVKLQLLEFNIE